MRTLGGIFPNSPPIAPGAPKFAPVPNFRAKGSTKGPKYLPRIIFFPTGQKKNLGAYLRNNHSFRSRPLWRGRFLSGLGPTVSNTYNFFPNLIILGYFGVSSNRYKRWYPTGNYPWVWSHRSMNPGRYHPHPLYAFRLPFGPSSQKVGPSNGWK